MDFNERLKQLRIERKLTQTDLAKLLNVKPTAVSNYESGRNEPSYEKLKILADYFNISLDYLLGLSDETFPIAGNIVDKDTYEFSNLYHQLDKHNKTEVKNFAQWLIYKQSNLT
jgi:transcriptional regulator with XRE-family HTH domain